jgi:hypothetical protein
MREIKLENDCRSCDRRSILGFFGVHEMHLPHPHALQGTSRTKANQHAKKGINLLTSWNLVPANKISSGKLY